MSRFNYIGTNESQKDVSGEIDSESKATAISALRDGGTSVLGIAGNDPTESTGRLPKPLTPDEMELLLTYVHDAVKAELPLPKALKAFSEDASSKNLRSALNGIAAHSENGAPLSETLANQCPNMTEYQVAILRAGESSGDVVGVLSSLMSHAQEQKELRAQVQEILFYPVLVLFVTYVTFLFVAVFVIPQHEKILADMGAPVPPIVDVLFALSNGIRSWKFSIFASVPVFVLPLILLSFWRDNPFRTDFRFRILHFIPVVRRLDRLASVARFTGVLKLLLKQHVELHDAILLAASAAGGENLQREGREAAFASSSGVELEKALNQISTLRPRDIWFLSNGYNSGDLHHATERLHRSVTAELERKRKQLRRTIGPLSLGFVGILVFLAVSSVYALVYAIPVTLG